MGQRQSQGKPGQRIIFVKNLTQRIDRDKLDSLRREFDRIQEGGTISLQKFGQMVMGQQVPEIVTRKLYQSFSSPMDDTMLRNANMKNWDNSDTQQKTPDDLSHMVMTFDDLCALYLVFKEAKQDEMLQVYFQLIKMSPDSKKKVVPQKTQDDTQVQPHTRLSAKALRKLELWSFMKADMDWLCSILQLDDQVSRDYYLHSTMAVEFPVSFEDWKRTYPMVKDNPLFNWVEPLMLGFSEENMNLDPEIEGRQYERRMTVQVQQKENKVITDGPAAPDMQDIVKSNTIEDDQQTVRLSSLEVENIREFWNNDIKNRPALEVHQLFRKMFKDMKNQKLKKYIFQSLSQVVGVSFMFLAELVLNICKQTTEAQKRIFLYNVFSKQSKQMEKKAIRDFLEIFNLPMQVFKLATFITQELFLSELASIELNYEDLTAVKFMIIAMTAITPDTDEEERQAILAAMNGHRNLDSYIYETLPEEQEYYVIEKNFWDQWCTALAIESDHMYTIKKEHKDFIDNKQLMMDMHQFRMKDLTYKQDFVLLPKYVFYPLGKWYSCDQEITRSVIQYKRERKFGETAGQGGFNSQMSHRFMMSSQKFYNPKEKEFQEELIHKKGELVYELEVNPSQLYLALINEKGEKPHQKAVINGNVDFNYIKKTVRADNLPFEELQLSRKTSLHQVLQLAAQTFGQNVKRGRLLIEDTIVSGTNLFQTLEEHGMRQGQLVYAEFCNSSNEYPIDLLNQKTNKSQPKKLQSKGSTIDFQGNLIEMSGTTIGLQNLGNTCYMNSALQVIANLKIIHEYFIIEKLHEKQTNVRNALGHNGQLVNSFSVMLTAMWTQTSPVVPRHFKVTVAKCCEQFIGTDQQDSQEYISFLIDGLHEELNLRMKKPYIQNPESKNRELNELGLENWSNSLLRNWSVIYFLFYGQMRSTLTCKKCNTESSTFDIFSNVPLSLPEPSQQTVSIIVYRVPNRVKDILQNKITRDAEGNITLQGLQRMESDAASESGMGFSRQNSAQGGLQRMHSSQSNRDRQHLAQFTESYNYMNNDQPMHVMIKVDVDIKIGDLITKIAQIRELNIEVPLVNTEIIIYQIFGHNNMRGVLNPEWKLSSYQLVGVEIMAAEILTRAGRETIKKFYMDNTNFIKEHPETMLRCLTYASEMGESLEGVPGYPQNPINQQQKVPAQNRGGGGGDYQQQTGVVGASGQHLTVNPQQQQQQRPITGESEYSSSEVSSSQMSQIRGVRIPLPKVDKYTCLHYIIQSNLNFAQITSRIDVPRDIFIIAYQRRFVKKTDYVFAEYVPTMIAYPLIFQMPKQPSGRRVYEEVWASAHVLLKPNSRFHTPRLRWWEKKNWREIVNSGKGVYAPYVLKMVDRTGYVCSRCEWHLRCSGCLLEPTDAPAFVEDMVKKSFLVIEWNTKILSEGYNNVANEVVEHASTRKKANEVFDQANYTTLDDCLAKFHKSEQLDNEVNCEKCESAQIHLKSLSISIPPPVMVIQLKRFRLYGQQWRKLQNLVDFPIRNLDITQFTSDAAFVKEQLQLETAYNLHGIVNHYGTLGFGHYVSYTKNAFDDKWYRYDDLYREEVTEDKINKESAYLLFYVRKDLDGKGLAQVMPNIESDYFAGKPVKIQGQDGFISENPTQGSSRSKKQLVIKLKNQAQSNSVANDQLTPEEDKHEIEYTANELRVLKRTNNNKINADNSNIKRKTRSCCGIMSGQTNKVRMKDVSPVRRNSIKQSGTLSQLKKPVNRQSQQHSSQSQQRPVVINNMEADSSLHSSSIAQPLIKGKQSPVHTTSIQLNDNVLQSPKMMTSARNIERERSLQLNREGKVLVQSQEGAINVVPRPRIKIPDGMGEIMDSQQSEAMAPENKRMNTEGHDLPQNLDDDDHGIRSSVPAVNSTGSRKLMSNSRIPSSGGKQGSGMLPPVVNQSIRNQQISQNQQEQRQKQRNSSQKN